MLKGIPWHLFARELLTSRSKRQKRQSSQYPWKLLRVLLPRNSSIWNTFKPQPNIIHAITIAFPIGRKGSRFDNLLRSCSSRTNRPVLYLRARHQGTYSTYARPKPVKRQSLPPLSIRRRTKDYIGGPGYVPHGDLLSRRYYDDLRRDLFRRPRERNRKRLRCRPFPNGPSPLQGDSS